MSTRKNQPSRGSQYGQYKFTRWAIDSEGSISALFGGSQSRCGIYILEFENGQRYVGQSIDVVRRFADHRRHFPDIVGFQFCPIPRALLDSMERKTVQANVDASYELRNIQLVSTSHRESPLDIDIDPVMQESWLQDGVFEPGEDRYTQVAERRVRERKKFSKLAAHPQYAQIFEALVVFISKCIIWPPVTVEERWTVSAMPSTYIGPDFRRLAVINCGLVEALVFSESKQSHWVSGYVNVSPHVFKVEEFPPMYWGRYVTTDFYKSAGVVGKLHFESIDELQEWLETCPNFVKACRAFTLGQMRKQPSLFAKGHCDHLADDLLIALIHLE